MKNKVNNKLDFSGQNIYNGPDTHLKRWRVTVRVGDSFFKTFSQDADPKILFVYLKRNFPGGNYFSAYEASFSGFSDHRKLNELGIKNIVVNPADIPTTDKERKQKEDARDSRKIAEQLAAGKLTAIHIPSIETEGDRSILRFRKTLSKEIARNKNRVKSHLYYHGIKIPFEFAGKTYWSKRFTNWLKEVKLPSENARFTLSEIIESVSFLRQKQLKILRKIRELSKTEKYKKNREILTSVPGVGLITAMTFLTETEDISRFKTLDKLCSFIGLVPTTNSTGENEKTGHITARQNKTLRSLIIESAWVAVRTDSALMASYQELIKRMPKTKAIIRISKKLLNRMKSVLKNQKIYEYRRVQ